jgi:hypothetical protein
VSGVRGALSDKPTQLAARFDAGFAWTLDRRSQTAREVASDLWELWTALGGLEALSPQQRWLCERVVYLRRRMLVYESAVMNGTEPAMTAGEYSNFANVCQGHLRTLGLERRARVVRSLATVRAEMNARGAGA